MFVIAGSASTHATSPGSSACAERVRIVERDHLRGERGIDRWTDALLAGHDATGGVEGHQGLVDRPVVAPVEHEDLLPVGGLARESQGEPVRIRCARRDLPQREPEPTGELLADDGRVLRRQHEGDAARGLLRDRGDASRRGSGPSSRRCRPGRSRCTRGHRRPRRARPRPAAANMGKPPGQQAIQFIGTPPRSVCAARSASSRDLGCGSTNRSSSARTSVASRFRSIA